ncbi:hypothetical protein [Pararhodobacter sp. SW119]|uniref:hypothetical protein n=1 Tax=Pararhodobacter sp. SW119 TaxID=2780075 RepID=UPI0032AFADC6
MVGQKRALLPKHVWAIRVRLEIANRLRELALFDFAIDAVQLLLGHTKMDSTVRYLGVELEDALAISEAVEI